jgi:hypothetical protein
MERLDLLLEEVLCPANMDGVWAEFVLRAGWDAGYKAVAILLKIGRDIRKGTEHCTANRVVRWKIQYCKISLFLTYFYCTIQLESTRTPTVS